MVSDAGAIAAAGDNRFLFVIATIIEGMKDGDSLAQNLRRFPRDFDPMFVQFVDSPSSREALRLNLGMLATNQ